MRRPASSSASWRGSSTMRSSWSRARPRRSIGEPIEPDGRRRCSSALPSTTSASRSCWPRSRSTRRGRCRVRHASARSSRWKSRSRASSSRSRPTWIPGHRDRIAFMRLCSGRYARGMRLYHTRLAKEVRVADALTFMAADRVAGRGGLRRRHHRPAQPRHDQHRRHVHRGRAAGVHGRARISRRKCSAAPCSRTR